MNSRITIRKITEADNLLLANLIRNVIDEYKVSHEGTVYSDSTTDNLFELFKCDRSELLVAQINNEIVGCCGIYPTKRLPACCAELVKFYLSPNARGKGIGKELLEKNIELAKELKYSELYLETVPQFVNAVGMYEKQGFSKIDKSLGKSGHTNCTIWMIKKL